MIFNMLLLLQTFLNLREGLIQILLKYLEKVRRFKNESVQQIFSTLYLKTFTGLYLWDSHCYFSCLFYCVSKFALQQASPLPFIQNSSTS